MDRVSFISSSPDKSPSKSLVKSTRKPKKKSRVARAASKLRRRRSAIRDGYQTALIHLAEKYLSVPTQGPEGLVFAIPELPPGHSRESLIHIFNDVLKDMGSSSNNGGNDANSGSMKFSNHSAHWMSPVSGPPVDLLSDEFFGPDDFDRYLGCASLKPLPAFPADR